MKEISHSQAEVLLEDIYAELAENIPKELGPLEFTVKMFWEHIDPSQENLTKTQVYDALRAGMKAGKIEKLEEKKICAIDRSRKRVYRWINPPPNDTTES